MICLLDMGLLALDLTAWNTDRQKCLLPGTAMALHKDWLLRYRIRIYWSDAFFNGFPWNQPAFPPELTDYCVSLTTFYSQMQANGLLVQMQAEAVNVLPVLVPDLLTEPHLAPFREVWLQFFAALICDADAPENGVAVPTWEQPATKDQREITVANAADLSAASVLVPLLKTEVDWQAFTLRFHKPDLNGVRIAVLGGGRAAFERARQRLTDIYRVAECRRLPPHYEENRTQQQTQQRLSQTDLLLICTNRLKHSDTEQIKNIEETGSLQCAMIRLNSDSADQIVQAIVEHYRQGV